MRWNMKEGKEGQKKAFRGLSIFMAAFKKLPSRQLFEQSQQLTRKNNGSNLKQWRHSEWPRWHYCRLWIDSTHCSGAAIADFKQVNTNWVERC